MNEQPMLPDMPADPEVEGHIPNVAKVFVRQVTEENIPLIAKESGKTETELLAMLMARREMQGPEARLRVRYLVVGEHHNHKPVKHRDGKQRWCDECGLTGDGMVPSEKKSFSCSECNWQQTSYDHLGLAEQVDQHLRNRHPEVAAALDALDQPEDDE